MNHHYNTRKRSRSEFQPDDKHENTETSNVQDQRKQQKRRKPACCICFNEFQSSGIRLPMLFPCGHGTCQACIIELKKSQCPTCSQSFQNRQVVPNWMMIELLDEPTDEEKKQHVNLYKEVGDWLTNKLRDHSRAMSYFQSAAEYGNVNAQFKMSCIYFHGRGVPRDNQKAIQWSMKAAEQGYAPAQRCIGYMYEHGYGVPQDFHKALEWYLKAAEQGDAPAQCNVGCMYLDGQGVPQDYHTAMTWYLKSADQDFPKALFNIGFMYENGLGVPQDDQKAREWIFKATRQGFIPA